MKPITALGLIIIACASTFACGSAIAPAELVSARAVYDRASKGPAATLDPADLHVAQVSLDAAEQSFKSDGNTQNTRDLSYTAERRTETAESRARTLQTVATKDQVVDQMHATTEAQGKMTAGRLKTANAQLASDSRTIQAQGAALQSETQLRKDADKRAAQSAADLAKFASVTHESRGLVITLAGGVLFTSGKSDLLPTAQVKLNEVAKALTEQDPESRMSVEGFTDSQGTPAYNQDLSQKRAQSVRDYLVSRGIASDRITAEGFGLNRAIADNHTPEGRANNRRVEIVVKPKS